MKKLMLTAVAGMALAGAGGAFADAECQSGSAWGAKPGCGGVASTTQQQQTYSNSGWSPEMAYGENSGYYPYGGLPQILGQVLSDGRVVAPQYQYQTPYQRTDRDRDGDGVRNNRDRYPDDPRYR